MTSRSHSEKPSLRQPTRSPLTQPSKRRHAVVALWVLALTVGGLLLWISSSPLRRESSPGARLPKNHQGTSLVAVSLPDGVTLGRCSNFTPSSLSATFEVGLDVLDIMGTGPLARGTIVVRQMNDTEILERKGRVTVTVTPAYDKQFLDLVSVCEISGQPREVGWRRDGIGIFTVDLVEGVSTDLSTSFLVEVDLPASAERPLKMDEMVFEAPLFKQDIGYLPNIFFDDIRNLPANEVGIDVGFISARAIRGYTWGRAGITGTFRATEDIVLTSTKGDINVNILLHDDQTSPRSRWRERVMGWIGTEGNINLSASLTSRSGTHGEFDIIARSWFSSRPHIRSRTDVSIHIDAAPVNSTTYIDAENPWGSAHIYPYPTFEGDFILNSPFFLRGVTPSEDPASRVDPAGLGRERRWLGNGWGLMQRNGSLFWDDATGRERALPGRIWVQAKLGSASIVY